MSSDIYAFNGVKIDEIFGDYYLKTTRNGYQWTSCKIMPGQIDSMILALQSLKGYIEAKERMEDDENEAE